MSGGHRESKEDKLLGSSSSREESEEERESVLDSVSAVTPDFLTPGPAGTYDPYRSLPVDCGL